VWATGERTSIEAAALRNAVAARYLDLNDTYVARAIVHPSDMVAVLAAQAEADAIGEHRFAEAVTVAYEVICRLADQANLHPGGFEASSLTPVAAAAGSAWLAGLNAADTANAINLASLDAAVLRAVRLGRLSHWKAVSAARGAVKGWFAVRATQAGLVAPTEAFHSPDGYQGRVTGPLYFDPQDHEPRLPRVITKQYPVQVFIQRPAALAAQLHGRIGDLPIESVVVHAAAQAIAIVGDPVPADLNAESADHSLRFAVAAMLTAGALAPGDIHWLLPDPRVRALAQRVDVVESPAYTAAHPTRLDADVEVRLVDGTSQTAASTQLEPDPAARRAKIRALTGADDIGLPWHLPGERG
jgi:2-methylcitrate dehydratase